jgi:transposase
MTLLPPGVKAHLAFGYTDMRKGIDGLAMLVQGVLRQDLFSGHLFVFRGRKANLIKIVFWDGTGLCPFTKRLGHGVFLWPSNIEPGGTLALSSGQLSMLIDGVDWRAPERQWRCAATPSPEDVASLVPREVRVRHCRGELVRDVTNDSGRAPAGSR